jgi:class 3 adenylate cyclase
MTAKPTLTHAHHKPILAARIAIDTGPVVIEAGAEIFGDVPNIAARAQALADRAQWWSPRECSAK